MNLPYPIDRFIGQPISGNVPPQLNYRMYNIPMQLSQFAPMIALVLGTMISQQMSTNALRVFFFNKMSYNNWENNEFRNLIEAAGNLIISGGYNINDQNQLYAACDEVVKYFIAYDFGTYYETFRQMIDMQTQNIMLNYIQGKGIRIPGFNNNVSYGSAPMQPMAPMGLNNPSGFAQVTPINMTATPATSSLDSERFSSNPSYLKSQETPMDRNVHQAGPQYAEIKSVPVHTLQAEPIYEDPISRLDITPLRHESVEFPLGNQWFDSMGELSNRSFLKYENFLSDTSNADFKYVIIRHFEYVVGAAPFSQLVLALNIMDKFVRFINGDLSREDMNTLFGRMPGRIKKLFAMFLEEIRLLTNNLIATNKCRTFLERNRKTTFIDDYNDLEMILVAKSREDIVIDLKIALLNWVNEISLFKIAEVEREDTKMLAAILKLNLIVVNVDSQTFSGYRLVDLDFLCELRVMTLYVITNNNVLFKIEFGSKYDNDKTRYYVPIEMVKIGPLL